MKILVTGANSYIGKSFISFMRNYQGYKVDSVSMQNGEWKIMDFSKYDVVLHTAGIVHKKVKENDAYLYFLVNRDLAMEVAQKAKNAGIKQFIYLSSMSVYGIETGVITKDTIPVPKSAYGKSKLEAEYKLNEPNCNEFKVCILRPPMVYGKDCKGNFQSMVKYVRKLPIFPKINNRRSMIYIDNLSSFEKLAIDKNLSGIYFPQNDEYVSTENMAMLIAKKINKHIYTSRLFGGAIFLLRPFVGILKKAFGDLIYSNTEDFNFSYCRVNFEESIDRSI